MEGEILKGHLDMIVLAALAAGPAHGYAVIEAIRRKSGGAFDLPEGTIYPVLHRLENARLLSSRWVTAESGRRRRVYSLTRRGGQALIGGLELVDGDSGEAAGVVHRGTSEDVARVLARPISASNRCSPPQPGASRLPAAHDRHGRVSPRQRGR